MTYIYMTHQYPAAYEILPIYKIKGDAIYRTHHHPDGYLPTAVMKIRDTSIYMTHQYPAKLISDPIYEIKGSLIYMTEAHPDTHIVAGVMETRQLPAHSKPIPVATLAEPVITLVPNLQTRNAIMPPDPDFGERYV